MSNLEELIFTNLLKNEKYARQILPYLKRDYFSDTEHKILLTLFSSHVDEYNVIPTRDALRIELEKKNVRQDVFDKAFSFIDQVYQNDPAPDKEEQWLIDETERFCKDKALYNAVRESIAIIDESKKDKKKKPKTALPEILSEALSVSFNTHIGHDYIDDADSRYEFYHRVEERIPFDLEYLNSITGGGVPKKTLNIIIGGTGVGKTRTMCHMAGANLKDGLNVLYVTFEMAEERIAERIDANLMGVSVDDLVAMPKDAWDAKIDKIKKGTDGKIIIQEYPTVGASTLHIKALLTELKLKKKFIPDVIYVDYLNIMASARMKMGGGVNSYTYVKAIAEELRGLAQQYNVPIWSGTQTNREGYGNTDFDMDDTAESFGLPMTADFMIGLITSSELEALNQIMIKQLKNRYSNVKKNVKGVIGVDDEKFRLYDLEPQVVNNTIKTHQEPATNSHGYPIPSAFKHKTKPADISDIHDKLKDIS